MRLSSSWVAGVLLTPLVVFGQTRPPTGWKDLSIGPPERTTITSNSIDSEGISVKQLLSIAYETPQSRIRGPEWLDSERRSILAIPDDTNKGNFKSMLRALLAERFKVVTHTEKRRIPVYVLRRRTDSPLKLQVSETEGACRANDGRFAGFGTIQSIAVCFEWLLNRPVVDETGLTGHFGFEIQYPGSPAVLLTAVRDFGLQLIPAQQELEVLVVETSSK
jgi:uncharacterized protein (TIGR03435 family)